MKIARVYDLGVDVVKAHYEFQEPEGFDLLTPDEQAQYASNHGKLIIDDFLINSMGDVIVE